MSVVIDKIKAKAEELASIRQQIDAIEEATKAAIEPLKEARECLQMELLEQFKKHELSSIKTNDGCSYARATRKGVEVISEVFALDWASKNHCVRIDSRLVAQKLKDATEMPAGFEAKEVEYISVRRPKVDKENLDEHGKRIDSSVELANGKQS